MKILPTFLRIATSLVIAATLVACGGTTPDPSTEDGANPTSESTADESAQGTSSDLTEEEAAVQTQAMNGDGIVNTFIGKRFSDETVTNEDEAEACVKASIDLIGGDETTELELAFVRRNEEGMTVATFNQRVGEMIVYGSTVKLVLDADDHPIALVGSIIPNARVRDIEEWAVDAAGAEQIVVDQLKAEGADGTIVEGVTERALVPLPGQSDHLGCAWIVYTSQIGGDNLQAYTAHYVLADGQYLYATPVSGPDDPDAQTGQSAKASFDFDTYKPDEMSVTLEAADGGKQEISLPVLKDPESGDTFLADAGRMILCADFAAYAYGGRLEPMKITGEVDPVDASTYHAFCRVWDYYDNLGWTGPDGLGTPTLLLLNYVDTQGKPVDNAAYAAKVDGFQMFTFTREPDFGKCLDVIGHEYTHCFTQSTMTANLYRNDPGAINEAMSDIMGNIIEMRLAGEEGAWTIAEGQGATWRNMADPHAFAQPEFTFDAYYRPHPPVATMMNDMGGVHADASLLSLVSYKLDQAGMTPKDQSYFWVNASLIMSPQSDYPMLAEMLPWVMEQLGYVDYVEPLKAAIDEIGFTVTEDPDTMPAGCGNATFDFADVKEYADKGQVHIVFYRVPDANPETRMETWPVAGTTVAKAILPAGDYYVAVSVGDPSAAIKRVMALTEDGWTFVGENQRDGDAIKAVAKTVTVEAGETLEISTEGFGELAAEKVAEVEQALAEMQG